LKHLATAEEQRRGGKGDKEDKEDKGDKGDKGDKEDKEDKEDKGAEVILYTMPYAPCPMLHAPCPTRLFVLLTDC